MTRKSIYIVIFSQEIITKKPATDRGQERERDNILMSNISKKDIKQTFNNTQKLKINDTLTKRTQTPTKLYQRLFKKPTNEITKTNRIPLDKDKLIKKSPALYNVNVQFNIINNSSKDFMNTMSSCVSPRSNSKTDVNKICNPQSVPKKSDKTSNRLNIAKTLYSPSQSQSNGLNLKPPKFIALQNKNVTSIINSLNKIKLKNLIPKINLMNQKYGSTTRPISITPNNTNSIYTDNSTSSSLKYNKANSTFKTLNNDDIKICHTEEPKYNPKLDMESMVKYLY